MIEAKMKSQTTLPAADASSHSANSAVGRSTSCTHRGTSTRGGCAASTADESVSLRSSSVGGADRRPVAGSFTFQPPKAKYV